MFPVERLVSLLNSYSDEKWILSDNICDLPFSFYSVTIEFRGKELGITPSKTLRHKVGGMTHCQRPPAICWTSFLAGSEGTLCVDCSCVYEPNHKTFSSLGYFFLSYSTFLIILQLFIFYFICIGVSPACMSVWGYQIPWKWVYRQSLPDCMDYFNRSVDSVHHALTSSEFRMSATFSQDKQAQPCSWKH